MTDPTPTQDTITARLEDLLARATAHEALPWVVQERLGMDETWCDWHRIGPVDFMGGELNDLTRFIYEAINALPALLSERATLKAELEEAREIIRPFGEHPDFHAPDDWPVTKLDDGSGEDVHGVTAGHFRAARAYLTKEPTNGR